MDFRPLPQPVVCFMNALRRREDLEPSLDGLEQEIQKARVWLEVHGAYAICPQEDSLLQNLAFLLAEVESTWTAGDWGRLAASLRNLYDLMGHIESQRRRQALADDAVINDFLLAGSAWLQGMAEPEAVQDRMPVVEHRLEGLRGLVEVYADQLHPEFAAEIEAGLERVEAGMAQVASALEAGDGELGEQGLGHMAAGAVAPDTFLAWEKAQARRLEETYSRYAIPRLGADFESTIERGRHLDRSRWGLGIWRLRKVLLPALETYWQELSQASLLKGSKASLTAPVEAALEVLRQVLASLTDLSWSAEELISGLDQALLQVSAALQGFREARLTREELSADLAPYYDAIQGILQETLPDLALEELLEAEPLSLDLRLARRALQEYLAMGDLEALGAALQELARHSLELQARPQESPEAPPALMPNLYLLRPRANFTPAPATLLASA